MLKELKAKIVEALLSVLPITLIVYILGFTPMFRFSSVELITFTIGAVLLILGIGLFSLGADLAMTPMGTHVGSGLSRQKKLGLLLSVCFVLGMLITIAEPDLQVLANQVSAVMNGTLLIYTVGIGVGAFLIISILKIVFKKSLSHILMLFYMLLFAMALLLVVNGNAPLLPMAFDSGGVTTGPITVPFIMALGVGISNVLGDRHSKENSFGLVSLCSVGPILAVLVLGIFSRNDLTYDVPEVSTDEVYGDLPLDRPDLFFTEETPIHTSSPYSSSKAGADLLVLAYHRTYGLPITISRCSNNYGPYHFPEKLIPLMIANALNDKPLPVYGEGLNVRDWLYVEDHCKAIDLIIHKGRVGEVYNIGGHNEMRNIDIVKIICKALGKSEDLITYVTDRKGHDMRYAIDPTKIHNELGWLPETMFADGIQKTIQWYLDNKEWWETIISGEYQNYYEKMYGNR